MSSVAIFSGNGGSFARGIDPLSAAASDSINGQIQTANGVRINEVQLTNASEGEVIQRCFGPSVRVGGQVIWASELIEFAQSYQGAQFFLYFVSVAIGICEGPISRIKRIWADGKIFYDVSNPTAGTNRYARLGFYLGADGQQPDSFMKSYNDNLGRSTPGYNGLAYLFIEGLALKDFGNRIPQFNFEVEETAASYSVGTAISRLVSDLDNDVDHSITLVDAESKGILVDSISSPASIIEQLFLGYDLTAAGGSGQVKFMDRGDEDTLTIPSDDLGGSAGTQPNRALWGLDFEDPTLDASPREVNVQYYDEDEDLQKGSQRSRRALPNQSKTVSQFDFPFSLSATDARKIGDRLLFEAWQQRIIVRLNLPPKYLELEETDIVTIDWEGIEYELRVLEIRRGFNFAIEVESVIQSLSPGAKIQITEGPADSGNTPAQVVYDPPVLTLLMLDLPPLSAAEATQVGYRAGVGRQNSADQFVGADLLEGGFASGSFRQIARFPQELIFGASITTLANPPHGKTDRWDEVSTVDVQLSNGELSSADAIDVLDGENFALLGNEIIAFKTATLISAGTYRLSGLLRGLRDTRDYLTHVSVERFVLLGSGFYYQPLATNAIGGQRYFKGLADGRDESTVSSTAFTPQGESLRPFAPCHIAGLKQSNNDWALTWVRRSRAFTRVFQQVTTPLIEPVEKYEIDILDGSTVVRTITVTSATSVTYTSAQQVTDFGSNQSALSIKIYQISDVVGRGNVAEANL